MKEAQVVEEKELIKPEFKNEIKAEIKTIGSIEDNIQEAKDYALKLNDYYSKIVFTEDALKEAKTEKADVIKFKDKVSEFRKTITKKYNEPLEKFISEAKEAEKILKDTYDNINNQVSIYEYKQKQEKEETIKAFLYEYADSKNIDFITYEQSNINVTLSASMKSLREQAKQFIDKIVDDIALINSQQYVDEMMIEYKKDLNVSKAITEVNNRHVELEKVKQEKEEKKEQKLTDEIMLNKIESLSAPKIETANELQTEQLVTATFKAICLESKMKKLVKFMMEEGIEYEQCK